MFFNVNAALKTLLDAPTDLWCAPRLLIYQYIQIFPSLPFHPRSRNIFPFQIGRVVHDVSQRGIHWNSFYPLKTGSNCAMSFISASELWCVSGFAPKGRCFTVNEFQPLTRGGRLSPSCLFCDYSPLWNFHVLATETNTEAHPYDTVWI